MMKYAKLLGLLVLVFLLVAGFLLLRMNPTTAFSPVVGTCPMFPANNIWNVPVDTLPVDPNSAAYITSIGAGTGLHPDFGSGLYNGGPIGIPYTTVVSGQPKVKVTFTYASQSDPGPYPVPPQAPIEGGSSSNGDRHVLVVDQSDCKLYELYSAYPQADGSWKAGSGAIFDLKSNNLRPSTWTSADAAGLPILPGLVRRDEVMAGEIRHALRFTVQKTRNTFIWPARHQASSNTSPNVPPMGQRFRLKANYDISSYPKDVQVILKALKTYGMIIADNGSNWFISGAPDPTWDNDILSQLSKVKGSSFEAVDESSLQLAADSGQAKTGPATLAVLEGSPQGAVINSPFPALLKAKVTDFLGFPVAGASVTFTIQAGAGSGTFAGGLPSYTSTTDSQGVITTPAITANNSPGTFTVTATVSGVTNPATFNLTNLASCSPAVNPPFTINKSSDDGTGTVCGSLSRALLQAPSGTTITFTLAGPNPTINVTGALPAVRSGVTVDGVNCSSGPSLTLKNQGTPPNTTGLTVQPGGSLKNVWVRGFPGKQILFLGGGTTNLKQACIVTSKT